MIEHALKSNSLDFFLSSSQIQSFGIRCKQSGKKWPGGTGYPRTKKLRTKLPFQPARRWPIVFLYMLTGFLNLSEPYNYKLVGNHFLGGEESKTQIDDLISVRSRRNSGRWKQYNQTMYQNSKAGMEYPYFLSVLLQTVWQSTTV